MTEFFQTPPELTNTFTGHRWLKAYLRFKLPAGMREEVEADLTKLGENCAGPYLKLARTAEREKPTLIPFDPWGKRVDEIRVSPAWTELQNISAREGLIAIGYERKHGEHSRVYQFAKLYLFHPSSAFFTCPLAMADGAAKVLEQYGETSVHKEALAHLTSRDPAAFWTSGQWMTERAGGSDVSETATVAKAEDGQARLYGTKWFSSATTSAIALALARNPDSQAGSKGLSLYLVPTYSSPGQLNHIRVLRLKDKLGTWALPTAELSLEGSVAYPIGAKDQGIKTVATMLNITRLYNSICSVGQATRALELLKDYSAKRKVFGRLLDQQPLHYGTFADEEVKLMAGVVLTMELVHMLGKEECGTASPEAVDVLRLMTPICKLFTARSAIQTASEVVEGFGGAGYIEDTGIPVHLRDSQVFPIWEGATNVLSLDLLRVMSKGQAMSSFQTDIAARLQSLTASELSSVRGQLSSKLKVLGAQLNVFASSSSEVQVASARELCFHLAWLYAALLVMQWADKETPENKSSLLSFLERMLMMAGEWRPKVVEDCQISRAIWSAALKD